MTSVHDLYKCTRHSQFPSTELYWKKLGYLWWYNRLASRADKAREETVTQNLDRSLDCLWSRIWEQKPTPNVTAMAYWTHIRTSSGEIHNLYAISYARGMQHRLLFNSPLPQSRRPSSAVSSCSSVIQPGSSLLRHQLSDIGRGSSLLLPQPSVLDGLFGCFFF